MIKQGQALQLSIVYCFEMREFCVFRLDKLCS